MKSAKLMRLVAMAAVSVVLVIIACGPSALQHQSEGDGAVDRTPESGSEVSSGSKYFVWPTQPPPTSVSRAGPTAMPHWWAPAVPATFSPTSVSRARPTATPRARPTARPYSRTLGPLTTPTRVPTPEPVHRECTCVQHNSDAGTVFVADGGEAFFQAIYSVEMDDGDVVRVGDAYMYGVTDSRFGFRGQVIGWDGCNMWLVTIVNNGSDLYRVDMLTGIAERVAKIREADGFDYGYISSIAWDGEFLYGVGLWGDLLRIDRDTGIAVLVEPARHQVSASTPGHSITWGDGVMYAASHLRIDVLDLERAHISERFYNHRRFIRHSANQVRKILWANGQLYFYTSDYGFYAVDAAASEPVWQFALLGPRDPLDDERGYGSWQDMAWVPATDGQCDGLP